MKNRVLTMGAFDMFHAGHMSLLRTCRDLAGTDGELIVGVNSDEFMAEYKRLPVIPYEERSYIIRNLDFVDDVYPVTKHDASSFLNMVNPNLLIIGEDWAHKDYFTQIGVSKEQLKSRDITLIYKSIDWDRTTTQTIKEIKNRD